MVDQPGQRASRQAINSSLYGTGLSSGSVPLFLLCHSRPNTLHRAYYSTTTKPPKSPSQATSSTASASTTSPPAAATSLPHLTSTGAAHMVRITAKPPTHRRAIARGHVRFTQPRTAQLIRAALLKKGDVLATARLAGIMAAKQCAVLVPLCHPIGISAVRVDVVLVGRVRAATDTREAEARGEGEEAGGEAEGEAGGIEVEAEVECTGATGVEMEALTAVSGACLTVVDMVKGVDRGAFVGEMRVVLKEGGRSGTWRLGEGG